MYIAISKVTAIKTPRCQASLYT